MAEDLEIERDRHVIVEADRGVDLGKLVRLDAGRIAPNPRKEIRRVLRPATPDELRHLARIRSEDAEALRVCRERVAASGLPMQTIDAEYQFDGNRVTFYFTAEGRIDFRLLVRDLAKIFRTRIELRQIPPRESAKRQGGLGPCGRPLCCSSYLQAFEPVTLKMAKAQNLALTPARISGMCGRLLCCLSYNGNGGEPSDGPGCCARGAGGCGKGGGLEV